MAVTIIGSWSNSAQSENALFDVAKRESLWTESIAVGSSPFIERIKIAMGAMAKGRAVRPIAGAFELRETQSAYNAIFDPENLDITPKKG